MREMKRYCGNGKPYIYGIFCGEDSDKALAVLERVTERGHEIWYGDDAWSAAEEKRLKKAAAALVFVSPAAVADEEFKEAVAHAVQGERKVIAIFLKETVLNEGLSFSLGSIQGIMKYAMKEEEFYKRLLESPVLSNLTVTPGQKAGSRRVMIGAIVGVAAVAAIFALVIGNAFGGGKAKGDSTLKQLGLSGGYESIDKLYLYGESIENVYGISCGYSRVEEQTIYDEAVFDEEKNAYVYGGARGRKIALLDAGIELPWGNLTDVKDFAQLENLEELCLAGNRIESVEPLKNLKKLKLLDLTGASPVDITSIGEFPALETLNIAFCGFSDNPEDEYDDVIHETTLNALLACKTLKTVYVDCYIAYESTWDEEALPNAFARAYQAGELPFEVVVVDRMVHTFEELKAACEEGVPYIKMMAAIEIPEGETITLKKGVSLNGVGNDFVNRGEMEIYGIWEMGPSTRENYGTIRIKEGGNYNGGMCGTVNYGTFVVEEGATMVLNRGHQYRQVEGTWEIDGTFLIPPDGGIFAFEGGTMVNNGKILHYLKEDGGTPFQDWNPGDLPGTGSYEQLEGLDQTRIPE